jgi:hypothetical protein
VTHGKNAEPTIEGAATIEVTTDPDPACNTVAGLADSEHAPAAGASGYSQDRVGSTGGPDASCAIALPDAASGETPVGQPNAGPRQHGRSAGDLDRRDARGREHVRQATAVCDRVGTQDRRPGSRRRGVAATSPAVVDATVGTERAR